jgi:hypothetical protein
MEIAKLVGGKSAPPLTFGKFPSASKSLSLLDNLAPQENVGKERGALVKANLNLKKIETRFRQYMKRGCKDGYNRKGLSNYNLALRLIADVSISSMDVGLFCSKLVKYDSHKHFGKKAGYFLSALINTSKYGEFELFLSNVFPTDNLCYKNTKNVIVHGNVGEKFGEAMASGELILNGDAGKLAGYCLKDGKITINGDADGWAGCGVAGGLLVINGNTSDGWGERSDGGEILIMGNAGKSGDLGSGVYRVMGDIVDCRLTDSNRHSLINHSSGTNVFQGERQLVKDGWKIAEVQNI